MVGKTLEVKKLPAEMLRNVLPQFPLPTSKKKNQEKVSITEIVLQYQRRGIDLRTQVHRERLHERIWVGISGGC